jgi:hypothetical protein
VPNLAPPQEPEVLDYEAGASAGDDQIIDDDDQMNIPAPDAAVFAPKPKSAAEIKAHRTAVYQSVEFRRTMIPILLTTGVLLLVFASMKFVLGADSPLSDLPMWLPVMLILTSLALLATAVLNMLSVKSSLAALDKK